jgi:hypothetical protein
MKSAISIQQSAFSQQASWPEIVDAATAAVVC